MDYNPDQTTVLLEREIDGSILEVGDHSGEIFNILIPVHVELKLAVFVTVAHMNTTVGTILCFVHGFRLTETFVLSSLRIPSEHAASVGKSLAVPASPFVTQPPWPVSGFLSSQPE